jgi:hypothetical protein
MTSTPEKSTEELVADEAAAAERLSDAEERRDSAFEVWKAGFVPSVRAAIHQQARDAAKRQAERTLEMSADAIAALKREIAAFADKVAAALDKDVTIERMSRTKTTDRGIRGFEEGPSAAHQELLVPIEEELGRLLERAGYEWRGWSVPGKSRAWDGPELDDTEKGLFRTLGARIGQVSSARADLHRASERVTASRALDAWGE